jgi:tRNA 2-thiouridine synthesizing protein D
MPDYSDFVITLAHNKSNPKQVTLAFTLGLKSLEKGHSTAIVLLLEGVQVGQTGHVDRVDVGEPFLPVKDMLPIFLENGGRLIVCGSCWKNAGIPDAERIAGLPVMSADQVIDLLFNAKATLQLN